MAADPPAELMSAYLDAELDDKRRAEFETLLKNDEETQREFAEMQQMLRMVAELPEVCAPPDFYEKLSKKIRKRPVDGHNLLLGLISLPFQVLSILVILVIAASFLMLELDDVSGSLELEKDPSAQSRGIAPLSPERISR